MRKGRVPVGSSDWLIVDALKAGNSSLSAIAAHARVEPSVARDALNRLRQRGFARMYGDKRGARYVPVNRRRQIERPGA